MPMPYDGALIGTALRASSRTWDFRFSRTSKSGATLGDIDVVGGSAKITHAALADKIKRSITLQLHPSTPFDFLSDRLTPYARLLMPDGGWQEWPLGTFLLAAADDRKGTSDPRQPKPAQGYDLLQVLLEDSVLDRHIVANGTNYTTAINAVLTAAGFTTSQVATTTSVTPAPLEWEPGTPRLKIVNDLLAAINYTPLTMTALGVPTAGPYVDPGSASVLWEYSLDTASLVRPGTVVTLDLFNVPNVIVAVLSEPDRPALVASSTNSDPLSPLSTVRRGRQIVEVISGEGAVDLTTLQAKVDLALQTKGQQYEQIVFDTGIMPFHNDGDVVTFDAIGAPNGGSEGVRYRETGWEMELRPGGVMRHTARRVVIVG